MSIPATTLGPAVTCRIGRKHLVFFQAEDGIRDIGVTGVQTCALPIFTEEPTFPQWTRAKSFDGFGAFGPVIATELKPEDLTVRTVLNGQERQNYPIGDMIIPPARIVSLLSRDMTLMPGDVICCGTSLGVGTMKGPRDAVEVTIDGVGTLRNVFE